MLLFFHIISERWDINDSVTAKLVLPLYDIPSTKRNHVPGLYTATKRIANTYSLQGNNQSINSSGSIALSNGEDVGMSPGRGGSSGGSGNGGALSQVILDDVASVSLQLNAEV